MRRVEKEMNNALHYDLDKACRIAKRAGYKIEVYDGDGETGMIEPDIIFTRPVKLHKMCIPVRLLGILIDKFGLYSSFRLLDVDETNPDKPVYEIRVRPRTAEATSQSTFKVRCRKHKKDYFLI